MKTKLLIVDDSITCLYRAKTLLSLLDVDIFTASSAAEALKHLHSNVFALILLDVDMPDIRGFDLAKIIYEDKSIPHTPIIFLTGIDNEQFKNIGYESGAIDYIIKSGNEHTLLSKVKAFLDLDLHKKSEIYLKEKIAKLLKENAELKKQLDSAT